MRKLRNFFAVGVWKCPKALKNQRKNDSVQVQMKSDMSNSENKNLTKSSPSKYRKSRFKHLAQEIAHCQKCQLDYMTKVSYDDRKIMNRKKFNKSLRKKSIKKK